MCWAHLRRDFQAMIDRKDTAGARIGEDLLLHADHPVRPLGAGAGRDADPAVVPAGARAGWVRAEVKALLATRVGVVVREDGRGVPGDPGGGGESLWTFAGRAGVEPTNNAAERAVRHAVCSAEDELRDGRRAGQPVRRADAHRGGVLPTAKPQRSRLPREGRQRSEAVTAAARGVNGYQRRIRRIRHSGTDSERHLCQSRQCAGKNGEANQPAERAPKE